MTILELIQSDATALACFTAGNDSGCAARCCEIAPPVRRPVPVRDVQRAAILAGVWPKIVEGGSNQAESVEVRGLCISVRDWIGQPEGTIDMDLPAVVVMLSALVLAGKMSEQQATQIRAMGNFPQVITVDEVSACRQ